ncbi:MAG: peptidylprolyl isomerase [Rhodoferax sp.]|nr:peptidylprolyl isomerase [Rhodoferax sp.]
MQRFKPLRFQYTFNSLMALVIAAFLTACGGGGMSLNPDPVVKKAIDVTSVYVQRFVENKEDPEAEKEVGLPLFYSGKVTVTISGTNLDAEPLTVRFPGCVGLEESAGGTGEQRVYTCTLRKIGYQPFSVLTTADLSLLWFSKVPIPYPQVTMFTSMGKIVFELDPNQAPVTVDNFLRYVHEGFYEKTIFHRVNANAILAGSLDGKMKSVPTHEPIELEKTGLSNLRGTIAMASATAQFFINVTDNQFLDTQDGGYAVFGNVIPDPSNMNVIDDIKAVETKTVGTYTEVPVTPITITRVEQTQ